MVYYQNDPLMEVLQECDKRFPKENLGTCSIPLDADPQLFYLSVARAEIQRQTYEFIRDQIMDALSSDYIEPEGDETPKDQPQSMLEYLDVLETQNPQAAPD